MTVPAVEPSSLESVVGRARNLFSLPAVASQVLELTENPEVDAGALARCIENDPALAAKILRVVNSSLFSISRSVQDMGQAVALLGVGPLKMLVLGFSLPDALLADLHAALLARYWRFALTKAAAARHIGRAWFRRSGDEAFLAGLLGDIGILVLSQELGDSYCRFFDRAWSAGGDLAGMEKEALGFDHQELSARLLAFWRLPPAIVRAIALPGEDDENGDEGEKAPAGEDEQDLLRRIVRLADLTARVMSSHCLEAAEELFVSASRWGRASVVDVHDMIGRVEENVRQLADVLALDIDAEKFARMVAEAQQRMALLSEEWIIGGGPPRTKQRADQEAQSLAELTNALRQAIRTAAPSQGGARRGAGAHARAAAVSPHEAGAALLARAEAAIVECRSLRCPLTLLLAAVDSADDLACRDGLEGQSSGNPLPAAAAEIWTGPSQSISLDDGRLAVLLPGAERRAAIDDARRLLKLVAEESELPQAAPPTGSVGLATLVLPPRNFPAASLLDAAARCLTAAQIAGGGMVKSIEL